LDAATSSSATSASGRRGSERNAATIAFRAGSPISPSDQAASSATGASAESAAVRTGTASGVGEEAGGEGGPRRHAGVGIGGERAHRGREVAAPALAGRLDGQATYRWRGGEGPA
jgi:hypothetical protein